MTKYSMLISLVLTRTHPLHTILLARSLRLLLTIRIIHIRPRTRTRTRTRTRIRTQQLALRWSLDSIPTFSLLLCLLLLPLVVLRARGHKQPGHPQNGTPRKVQQLSQ